MRGRLTEILRLAGGEWRITFTTPDDPVKTYYRMKDHPVDVEIKRLDKKRSLNANAFCWALCSDIGKAMTPPLAKEEVYRTAIRAVGVYSQIRAVVWDVDTIMRRWSSHGEGWFADIADDAGTGYKLMNLYYGTSTYTADEMRILIDWLVDQCEQMDIRIPLSKAEAERLVEEWGRSKASSSQKTGAISADA